MHLLHGLVVNGSGEQRLVVETKVDEQHGDSPNLPEPKPMLTNRGGTELAA